MQNEILKPVLATDETAIPRYDIVNPDGSVTQQNVELRLKNQVIQEGTPYDEESVLPAKLATQLGLTATATPAKALQLLANKSYSKDETISNETKTLFGLGADAVPDDVLSMLYRAANYAWKRRAAGYVEKRTAAPSGVRFNLAYGTNSVNCSQTVEYSEEIEINSTTGAISLKNPQTLTIPWSGGPSIAEVLKGKYVKNTYSSPDDIVFISASATINNNSSSSAYWVLVETPNSNVFIISSEITAQGDWSIVYAPGRSTYPDNGISNGYEYVFLGNPLDNAISPQKIETGSYVGTGTKGSDSEPLCITTSSKPAIIFVKATEAGSYRSPFFILFPCTYDENYKNYTYFASFYASGNSNVIIGYAKIIGNSVYFYNTSYTAFNEAGIKYVWIAICGLEDIA